jgi:Uma2 family endonuclease
MSRLLRQRFGTKPAFVHGHRRHSCWYALGVSAPATSSGRLTETEYLGFERESPVKHEYWNGEVFAMAGASFVHNQIVMNVGRALLNATDDGPCIVLSSDTKVRVPLRKGYVYPDVSVVCGKPEFVDDHTDVITNPQVIVEVLSDSTERFDRGDKFAGYRSLPSLVDYLLVAQDQARVEHYTRGADGTWVLRELQPGMRLRLTGVPGEIAIDDIYRKVTLPAPVPE